MIIEGSFSIYRDSGAMISGTASNGFIIFVKHFYVFTCIYNLINMPLFVFKSHRSIRMSIFMFLLIASLALQAPLLNKMDRALFSQMTHSDR